MITLFWLHYCAEWRALAFRLTLPLSLAGWRSVAHLVKGL